MKNKDPVIFSSVLLTAIVSIRRQHAVGIYIPDFCSPKAKLIIELDGSQHLEQEEYDEERTKYLEARGYKVIRFWNNQVMNDLEGVIKAIIYAIESNERSSHRWNSPLHLAGIFGGRNFENSVALEYNEIGEAYNESYTHRYTT